MNSQPERIQPETQQSGNLLSDSEGFVSTKEHKRFVEFCDAVRRYHYIGLCYGPPGVGKTLSARHYAHWDFLEPLMEGPTPDEPRLPPEVRAVRTLLYTPPVANTPGRIEREVQALQYDLNALLRDTTRPVSTVAEWLALPDCADLIIVDLERRPIG